MSILGAGWTFSHHSEHLFHDLLVLNAEAPLPDMELVLVAQVLKLNEEAACCCTCCMDVAQNFKSSQEFTQIKNRNADGSVTPVFRSTGSRDAYDLVLPDATWRLGGAKCDAASMHVLDVDSLTSGH